MANPTGPSTLTDQMVAEDDFQLLPAVNDEHGGVIVQMEEPMDGKLFLGFLRASMSKWRHEGKKGIWIKLPIGLSNLVEYAVKEGFWYHHAKRDYLMLVYWIPETLCTIPLYATHSVGVDAIVLNEKREVLVVQEVSGRFQGSGVCYSEFPSKKSGHFIFTDALLPLQIDAEFVEVAAFRYFF